jgi:hypothetical protein
MTRNRIINRAIAEILDSRGTEGLPSSYEQGITCRLETIDTGETVPTLTIRPMGDGSDFSVGPAIQLIFDKDNNISIRSGKEKWNSPVRLVNETNERPDEGVMYIDNSVKVSGSGSSHNPLKDTGDVILRNGDTIIFTSSINRYSALDVDKRNISISSRKGKSKISEIRLSHSCGDTSITNMISESIEVYTNSNILIKDCNINSLIVNGSGTYNIVCSHIANLNISGKAKVMLDDSTYTNSDIGHNAKLFRITKNIEEIR